MTAMEYIVLHVKEVVRESRASRKERTTAKTSRSSERDMLMAGNKLYKRERRIETILFQRHWSLF